MNIYILFYAICINDVLRVITYTSKSEAIYAARYYRDELHFESVILRHDKKGRNEWCDIQGYIDF